MLETTRYFGEIEWILVRIEKAIFTLGIEDSLQDLGGEVFTLREIGVAESCSKDTSVGLGEGTWRVVAGVTSHHKGECTFSAESELDKNLGNLSSMVVPSSFDSIEISPPMKRRY